MGALPNNLNWHKVVSFKIFPELFAFPKQTMTLLFEKVQEWALLYTDKFLSMIQK